MTLTFSKRDAVQFLMTFFVFLVSCYAFYLASDRPKSDMNKPVAPSVAPASPCKPDPCPPAVPCPAPRPFTIMCPVCRSQVIVTPPPFGSIGSALVDNRRRSAAGAKPPEPKIQ